MTLEIYNKGVDQFLTPYYVAHLMAEMNFSEKGKQLKKGYPLQMNWTLVPGSKGAVKIKPSSYNNSTYNDVDNLYPSVDSYCQTKKWLRLLNSYNNQFDELNQKRHNKTIGKNHRCYTSSIANSGISTWSIFGGSYLILGEGHHTQDFSDHTDWIIEELTKDSTRTYFLEINWFDEPTIIDIEMAKK